MTRTSDNAATPGRAPRVPLVDPGTRPELAEIERAILAERGRISLLYRALLNSAPIASGWEKLLTAVRNRTQIPAKLRELAILRVAVLNRASFEFHAHIAHALKAGLSDEQIDAVRSWQPDAGSSEDATAPFDADEALVLELADAMTLDIEVGDALMDRVRARFDPRGVVELVATVAAYNMVSRFLVALDLTHRE
jgi:AhpD family alkylhydroperoxidase